MPYSLSYMTSLVAGVLAGSDIARYIKSEQKPADLGKNLLVSGIFCASLYGVHKFFERRCRCPMEEYMVAIGNLPDKDNSENMVAIGYLPPKDTSPDENSDKKNEEVTEEIPKEPKPTTSKYLDVLNTISK